ncbi:phosphatidylserine decarboxylase [bacterium]|nr:phosphatidylserine decarboxylase [bacterium]
MVKKETKVKQNIDLSIRSFLLPKISNEGAVIVAIFFAISVLLLLISNALGLLAIGVSLFAFYFFRDPERYTPKGEGLIVAPADGIVLPIKESPLPEELKMGSEKYVKISIFMSLFNVHVNRNPVSGKVLKTLYIAGKFFNADLDKASKDNERNLILVETDNGDKVCYVQIAGLIARRIVSRIEKDDEVVMGERFGLIKFGSRLDVYIPKSKYDIEVMAGQRMVSGETILARLKK